MKRPKNTSFSLPSHVKQWENIDISPAYISDNNAKIKFSMEYLEGDYCLTKCQKEDKTSCRK